MMKNRIQINAFFIFSGAEKQAFFHPYRLNQAASTQLG
jgi:hypothetical protein